MAFVVFLVLAFYIIAIFHTSKSDSALKPFPDPH